jgi:hypothetical protein
MNQRKEIKQPMQGLEIHQQTLWLERKIQIQELEMEQQMPGNEMVSSKPKRTRDMKFHSINKSKN